MHAKDFVVITSVLALSLCGCVSETSDNPQSNQSATATESSASSRTSTTTPTPKAKKYHPATANGPARNVPVPDMTSEATKNTESGAAAFAEYYLELINFVVETNNAEPIKPVTTRQCEYCGEALIDAAALGRKLGVWQVGGKHHGKVMDSYKPTKDRASVTIKYWISASTVYREPNKIDSEFEKTGQQEMILDLVYNGRWQVDAISGES